MIVKDIEKQYEKDQKILPPRRLSSPFGLSIKWQLVHQFVRREEDGYPVYQENFLRQSIKEFPFPRPGATIQDACYKF